MHARIAPCLAVLGCSLFVAMVSAPAAPAQAAVDSAPPIPPLLANARTIFLSNGGADGGLFPEPFSGDPNRAYFTLFSQLKAAGKYELVSDPAQADLVMELRLLAPNGPREPGKQWAPPIPSPSSS